MTLARRFLWIVFGLTLLVILVAIVWRLAGERLIRTALTPEIEFADSPQAPPPDYGKPSSWVARPDLKDNPALWAPAGFRAAPRPAAAVFFVSPTAFLARSRWNAPLDDSETNVRLVLFTRMQASVFNGVAEIWVPRTRQATLGTFFADTPDARKALDLAYSDVERAFDAFLEAHPGDTPIILAGHSQGARHILHLMLKRGGALKQRIVAVYAVGWPISEGSDTAVLPLPLCRASAETGCILSWQSFAADGDVKAAEAQFATVADLSGRRIGTAKMACVNPLSGSGASADAAANAGTLIEVRLEPKRVGARCSARGMLLISPTPDDMGAFVLPGGNFHVYDYSLFWANVRSDVEARLSTFGAARAGLTPR